MESKTENPDYPTIKYSNLTELPKLLKKHGVVVIENVFTNKECNELMKSILDDFEKVGKGIDKDDSDTWIKENLPPQTRHGLYQALVGNLPAVWKIRKHKHMLPIFKKLYTDFRGREINDYICSLDGINIQPNVKHRDMKDWAHSDQTDRSDVYKCVQGQAVLTNTSASFRATPKSHLYFDRYLDIAKVSKTDKSNWIKFNDTALPKIKNYLEKRGCKWQVPIKAKKGSFIVWLSSTIHSASSVSEVMKPTKLDPYRGWRGVIYVCYRPTEEFTPMQIKKRNFMIKNNRLTNHWTTKMFPKVPGGMYVSKESYCSKIQKLLDSPEKVYDLVGMPQK
jgi:hypothetical protein